LWPSQESADRRSDTLYLCAKEFRQKLGAADLKIEIDPLYGPSGQGSMRVIAFIEMEIFDQNLSPQKRG
jgi:hypothetical protein